MPIENEEINLIKRLCILNFLELQYMKRKLNIASGDAQDYYDHANSVPKYLKELDWKMRDLIKDYPHLLDDSPADENDA